jgi:hypothetical protein
VSGVVNSVSDGLPLLGVNVIEKGASNGISTDFDGKYKLKTGGGKLLQYSYLGYKTEELPIHSSSININLDEDMESLEVVVISGYGSSKKAFTGASSTLKPEHISSAFAGNLTSVRIRGGASLKSYKNVLYVIDEVPMYGRVNTISSDNIASLNVLKGPNVTAIYGHR